MKSVNALDAEMHFSTLLKQVESGEEIAITKGARPVARLVPATETLTARPLGFACGLGHFWIAEDFDEYVPAEWRET